MKDKTGDNSGLRKYLTGEFVDHGVGGLAFKVGEGLRFPWCATDLDEAVLR